MAGSTDFDWLLVGGGLQTGLLVLALRALKPHARVAVVEGSAELGGNHTWCFHERDVPETARSWVEPLVERRWPAYEVRFPELRRVVEQSYSAVTSTRFASVITEALRAAEGCAVRLNARAARIGEHEVRLEGGERLTGRRVVDARGPEPPPEGGRTAYQLFVGQDVELREPLSFDHPILMDATVEQQGGFRFFYCLPWEPKRLLVEETFFSPDPVLDVDGGRTRIAQHIEALGLEPVRVEREEQGVLAMPWERWHEPPAPTGPLACGVRGGFFHPATGYSFGQACRVAEALASASDEADARQVLGDCWQAHERQARFVRTLNRMVFCGWEPRDWWRVFRWFHRLPDELVSRFYALELRALDRGRILAGLPPSGMSLRNMWKG